MAASGENARKSTAPKPEASAVIERAIAAMRQNPQAHSVADAIEAACRGRSFDVDAAVKWIRAPTPQSEESS